MTYEATLVTLDQLKHEIDTLRPIDPDQEKRVMAKLRLEWNYHSNAIEGNSLSFGETKAFLLHGITAKGKPFKDYLDIKGHDQVIEALSALLRNEDELTEALIRELHKILLVESYVEKSYGPDGVAMSRRVEIGQYKSSQNFVISASGQEHLFATPAETPARMEELIQWYRNEREQKELHPLVLAAGFHYRFVAIHPFDDGNGRMARILMNFILMQNGYLPVVLSSAKRAEYFLALSAADGGDLSELIGFIADAAVDTASIYLKAARGEPIDELADFDKRLRLLSQSLRDGEQLSADQRSAQRIERIIRDFVTPLFNEVGARFAHLAPSFGSSDVSVMWMEGGIAHGAGRGAVAVRMQTLSAETAGHLVDNVYMAYHGRAFIKDTGKDFFCRIDVFFHASQFAVALHLTGNLPTEVFKSNYSELVTSTDSEKLAATILAEMVTAFEKLITASGR